MGHRAARPLMLVLLIALAPLTGGQRAAPPEGYLACLEAARSVADPEAPDYEEQVRAATCQCSDDFAVRRPRWCPGETPDADDRP